MNLKQYTPVISQLKEGCLFKVLVKPSSIRQHISFDNELGIKIEVKSPPQKGKANHELIQIFAEVFKVKQQSIVIIRGATLREKWILIHKLTVDKALDYLNNSRKKKRNN
jgi:uncharacterized protein (TIGR00251 family)